MGSQRSKIRADLALRKLEPLCSCCVGQHHGSVIHQQGGGHEIRFSLCPSVASPFLVQQPQHPPVSPAHIGLSERDSRQVVQAQASDPDGGVSPSGGIQSDLSQVAQAPNRPDLNQSYPGLSLQFWIRGLGPLMPLAYHGIIWTCMLPPSSPSGQCDQQTATSNLSQDDSDSPGVAQHALVLF